MEIRHILSSCHVLCGHHPDWIWAGVIPRFCPNIFKSVLLIPSGCIVTSLNIHLDSLFRVWMSVFKLFFPIIQRTDKIFLVLLFINILILQGCVIDIFVLCHLFSFKSREDNEWWILPIILFLIKSLQAGLVNWHVANLEIQDYTLFSPDPDRFWAM